MNKFFPALQWLRSYDIQTAKSDLSAGLTVGMMLIPQGMAYAMLAGLDPIYGLYTSIVPLIIYAFLGSSRQLAVGPVAMVSLLVAAAVSSLGITDPYVFVEMAIVLALMIGVIQFLLGVLRMGFLVNFLSHPVISGFTSAAALIIGLNQLKHLFGISSGKSNFIHEIIIETIQKIPQTNIISLLIGLAAIVIILWVKKKKNRIPGQLIAVVLGIAVVYFFGLEQRSVQIVGEIPTGLPPFKIPTLDFKSMQALLPMAITISLIAFMESIAVAKAIQKRHKDYKVDANQELIALGMANIVGSFFRSFPSTGGFSRTAVNDQAGAKTGMASIFSAIVVALSIVFLTPLFYFLPQTILASVIMVAVFGLIDIKEIKHLWQTDRADFAMLIITFVSTLALGIEKGILTGVLLSILLIIFKTTRPHYAILGEVNDTGIYKNLLRYPEAKTSDDVLILRFDARLYFANAQYFSDIIWEEIAKKDKGLKLLILDAESINDIDSSGMHCLKEIATELREKHIDLYLSAVKGPVRDKLEKNNYLGPMGRKQFYSRISEALDYYHTGEQGIDNDLSFPQTVL
jgi:SulP family sulfate permease